MATNRSRITYGQTYVLCSQAPSYQDNTFNVSGLKRVQSSSIDFSFARERFKQVGSENFVGDVHLRNADVNISLNYYYSNGTNEALMGLNVDGNSGHAAKYIKKENQDRNYYIVYGSGDNDTPLDTTTFVNKYDVMGLGNCYLNSYSISASLGSPVSVSTDLSAYNMQLDQYDDANGKSIPAIDTSNGYPTDTYKYKILTGNIYDTTNLDGNIDAAFSPNEIDLILPSDINVPGLEFSGTRIASIQSMGLSFSVDRHNLYGFGSMYPYGRRAKLPILGSLSFSALAGEFTTGILHDIINSGERSFDFTFNFKNCSGATGLQLVVENAKMDSQGLSETIGDSASVDVSFSFPMSSTTGFRISTPPLITDQIQVSGPSLSISVTGKSPFTYQWYNETGPTQVGSGPTYTATSDGNYYCKILNDLGETQSRTVYVDVP